MSTGQPLCSGCGVKLAALKSHALRNAWSRWEYVKWIWHSDTLAFWTLCVDCHNVVWPMDRRYNDAHSRPFDTDRRGATGVRSVEFYLTSPPPEFMQRSFSKQAMAMVCGRGDKRTASEAGLSVSSSSSSSSAMEPNGIENRESPIFYYHVGSRLLSD